MSKKVIISVISDLATDQRVQRTAQTIAELGFEVTLVGRQLPSSIAIQPLPFRVKRFKLWINKGPFFYLLYNIRLFFFLKATKPDILFSNDLDTLPANFLISKFKGICLYYDSHEYFTGVPELLNRPLKRKIWKWLEKMMMPQASAFFTVNESIAGLYKKEYGLDFKVMRNIPAYNKVTKDRQLLRTELGLPNDRYIYIMQGSGINVERGAEEAVLAMQYINDGLLLIVGGGDVIDKLKKMIAQLRLEKKVFIIPKMIFSELQKHTAACDIGLTLDKDLSINYRFSLPNKLFDYIHAGIPVLASDLPEVRKIIEQYHIGMITLSHDPKIIAALLQKMTGNATQMDEWKRNAGIAAEALNWQKEKQVLIKAFQNIE